VVRDARAGVTRPVGRSAEKINGDRPVWRPIEEAEHRAFLAEFLKTQSLRQKCRRVLKTLDLNLDGSNPSNRSIGRLLPVLITRACIGGFFDQSQLETIRVPEAETLLSERPSVAYHIRASLHQAAAPALQCSGRPQKQWS
jgi:hypothetical protein